MTIPLAIYLHIPFCRSKCTYCAFNTYTKLEALIPEFVQALRHEIVLVGDHQPVHTIFFGGGTPSLLTPSQLAELLLTIHDSFDVLPGAEITIEANPNDLSFEYLAQIRASGVNRLSLGVQSTNHSELRLFARRHNNDEVAEAVSAARRAGFASLNVDLIYGVPHQTLESWSWSLRNMLALQPDHLSLYALGLEEDTPMYDWVEQGSLPRPDDDLAADMYVYATDVLADAGYLQYEISNWARPGQECRHNLQYWRNLPYVGLGPGAHGYAAGKRYWTLRSPQRYIEVLKTPNSDFRYPLTPATDDFVDVDRSSEIGETLMMGLRLIHEGIQRREFQMRFGDDLIEIYGPAIERFVTQGLLEVSDEQVRLTKAGRLLSNVVLREFV